MIAIVNYGLGNVHAFAQAYKRLGIEARVATTPRELEEATRIILPGVGSFDWAMALLEGSGMRAMLDRRVIEDRVPVLGVCVGMQMMARASAEGSRMGLGWIDAYVERLGRDDEKARLPHMGWNSVAPHPDEPLFRDLDQEPSFYFLHSYHVVPRDGRHLIACTSYHQPFASAVRSGNVWGTQFHPEKSHNAGMVLLRNFAGVS